MMFPWLSFSRPTGKVCAHAQLSTCFLSSLSTRLTSELGLSAQDVAKTCKKLRKTIGRDLDGKFEHDPNRTLTMLSEYGMSAQGQRKVVVENLLIFKLDPAALRFKWNWYAQNFGMSNQQIAKMVATHGDVFEGSLERRVDAKAWGELFSEMGLQQHDLRSVLISNPALLGVSLEENLRPRLQKLIDVGVPKNFFVPFMIKSRDFFKSTHQLDAKLTFFGEVFGTDRDATVQSVIAEHPKALSYSLTRVKENLGVLIEGGVARGDAGKVLVSAAPHEMKNLKAKLWVILTLMKRGSHEIARFPKCLTSPFYNRFLIRVAFLRRTHEEFDVFTLDDLFRSEDSEFAESILNEGSEKRFHKFAKWWIDLEDKSQSFDDFDALLMLMKTRSPPKLFRSTRWSAESPCSAYVF